MEAHCSRSSPPQHKFFVKGGEKGAARRPCLQLQPDVQVGGTELDWTGLHPLPFTAAHHFHCPAAPPLPSHPHSS